MPVPSGPPGAMVFWAPARCGACRADDQARRIAEERHDAYMFYREHIWEPAAVQHRDALEACAAIIVTAIIQAWEDAGG